MRIQIAPGPITPFKELENFAAEGKDFGALASFIGVCRAQDGAAGVLGLELEHYPGFTEAVIERLAAPILERCAILDALIIHRVGMIAPGEPIVLVAALAAHRAAAHQAVEMLMDMLKTEAPFWKRERTSTGARWIEPTSHDYDRRRRAQ